jgi:hypothetical protein
VIIRHPICKGAIVRCGFFIIRHKIKITGKSLQQPAQSFSSCWLLSTSTCPTLTETWGECQANYKQLFSTYILHYNGQTDIYQSKKKKKQRLTKPIQHQQRSKIITLPKKKSPPNDTSSKERKKERKTLAGAHPLN